MLKTNSKKQKVKYNFSMTFLRFQIGTYIFAFLFRTVKQIMEKDVMVFGEGFERESFVDDVMGINKTLTHETEYLKFVFDSRESIAINIPLPVRSFEIDSQKVNVTHSSRWTHPF